LKSELGGLSPQHPRIFNCCIILF